MMAAWITAINFSKLDLVIASVHSNQMNEEKR